MKGTLHADKIRVNFQEVLNPITYPAITSMNLKIITPNLSPTPTSIPSIWA